MNCTRIFTIFFLSRSDRLWESYIKWELEGKRLSRVTALYDRLLCTPTLGYISHFDAFQEFVSSNLHNRILNVDDFLALRAEVKALLKSDDNTSTSAADDAPPGEEPPPHELPPTDEETRAIREKIISSRRKMHKANINAVAARWSYEEGVSICILFTTICVISFNVVFINIRSLFID